MATIQNIGVVVPFSSTKQTFVVQLGVWKLRFTTVFNEMTGIWHTDIADDTTGNMIQSQVAILLGEDLLRPMNLGIGSLVPIDTSGQDQEAGPNDLGDRVQVVYLTPSEAAEILASA